MLATSYREAYADNPRLRTDYNLAYAICLQDHVRFSCLFYVDMRTQTIKSQILLHGKNTKRKIRYSPHIARYYMTNNSKNSLHYTKKG